jgi:hypothetical protein
LRDLFDHDNLSGSWKLRLGRILLDRDSRLCAPAAWRLEQ